MDHDNAGACQRGGEQNQAIIGPQVPVDGNVLSCTIPRECPHIAVRPRCIEQTDMVPQVVRCLRNASPPEVFWRAANNPADWTNRSRDQFRIGYVGRPDGHVDIVRNEVYPLVSQ